MDKDSATQTTEDDLDDLLSGDSKDIFAVDDQGDEDDEYTQYDHLDDSQEDEEGEVSFLWVFSPAYYQEPEIPDDATLESDRESDDETTRYALPQVVKPWVCEYYYPPQRKANMSQHLVLGAMLFFVALSSMLESSPGGILSIVLVSLLIINVAFRRWGLALYKYPMPEIPFVPSVNVLYFVELAVDKIRETLSRGEEERREKEKDDEFTQYKEDNSTEIYVDPVDDYHGDAPSPATILSEWMNSVAHMTQSDLAESSDGRINKFVADMLLKDNPEVWDDEDILDSLAAITSSNVKEWEQARDAWRDAE